MYIFKTLHHFNFPILPFLGIFWQSAPGHSCDGCRSYILCRLMTGRSHDSSACTLMQDPFSEEKREYLDESLAMC